MTMHTYRELKADHPFSKKKYDLYSRIIYEIETIIAVIIIQIAIKYDLSANLISLFSVTITLILLILSEFSIFIYLSSLIYFIIFFIHAFDRADGFIARKKSADGIFGHLIDESSSMIIVDLIYMFFILNVIMDSNTRSIILIFILLLLKYIRIKNYFYRILHNNNKYPMVIKKTNSPILPISKNFNIFYKILFFLNKHDFRLIVLTLAFNRILGYDFRLSLTIALIVLHLTKQLADFRWVMNKDIINELEKLNGL